MITTVFSIYALVALTVTWTVCKRREGVDE